MSKKIVAGIGLLGIVILAGYLISQRISISWIDTPTTAQTAIPITKTLSLAEISKAGKEQIWICPMHPEIMQNHPGTCPICGMDLVPSKNSATHNHDHSIHIDTASIQKLGVRLASIKKTSLSQEIRTYGNVIVDGDTLYNVHTKVDGWIKKLNINSVGQQIRKGQIIYEIYSPDLITQQKEYLRFVVRRDQTLKTIGDISPLVENPYVMDLLQELSRERTKFLYKDIGIESVQQMEDSKQPIEVVKILAGQAGIVTQINAREGNFVTPSTTLFTLADVSRIWVDITLYPDQVGRVQNGDSVTIKTPDGQKIKTKLDFINPLAENNKINARVTLNNTNLHLRPGSFVDVIIHAQPHEALVLPRSSVIHTGQGDSVILSRGDGHFLPVNIETGIESGDWIEVVDGLLEGAEVAVNGQFLLDAASSLQDAAQRMQESHKHQ
ncbi:MAG: membrane fusion protein, Cu(I)/Ag(I) efflux system [Candidatus Nitrotoga sp. SPKER]|nr:MAG: membrane fusion protein, Cu(I)/Ag(I) efflux system [Candidatus Nitrotoga sp. SPKER]